jgi:hypothetical protein
MNRLQIFLSNRWTGFVFTLVSILAINCWQLVLSNFSVDNTNSIAAAKNIHEGHGYSIKMASPVDFSKSYYAPIRKWPPGYAWLLVLVYKLLNTDWIHSAYVLNAIGLSAIVLIFRKMLFQLEFPAWIVHSAVLYFGFIKHAIHYASYSDIFGLLFFLLGLCALLKTVKSEKNIMWMVLLAAASLGTTAYMKYLYIPLCFIPLISFSIYGYMNKRKDFQAAAGTGLLFLVLLLFFLFLFQFNHPEQDIYLKPTNTGFFPDQILWLGPVFPASFLNIDFINMQVSTHSRVGYETMSRFWALANLFLICWLVYICYKLFRLNYFTGQGIRKFYVLQVFLFVVTLFGFLFLLTVTKSKHYADTVTVWVYFQELRYYAVVSVFALQFACLLLLKPGFFFNKNGSIIFRCLIMTVLLEEIGHGAYFNIKQMGNKKYGVGVPEDRICFETQAITRNQLTGSKNVVFCSGTERIANMSSLTGVPVFYEPEKLRRPVPSSLPVKIIVAIDKTVPHYETCVLLSPEQKSDYIFNGVYFYIVDIPKSKN